MKKVRFGFTLVELLIVIVVIGILSAAFLPTILGAPEKARDAARIEHLGSIVKAIEAYALDNGGYPAPSLGKCLDNNVGLDSYFQGGKVPQDPGSGGMCGTSKNYFYMMTDGKCYVVGARMELPVKNGNSSVDRDGNVNCTNATLFTDPPTSGTVYRYLRNTLAN